MSRHRSKTLEKSLSRKSLSKMCDEAFDKLLLQVENARQRKQSEPLALSASAGDSRWDVTYSCPKYVVGSPGSMMVWTVRDKLRDTIEYFDVYLSLEV